MPAYLLLGVMGVYLPKFYASHLGISLLVLGGTIAAVRLSDLGVDLVLGMLMDKTKTPIGRYRPWYLLGLPVVALASQAFNRGRRRHPLSRRLVPAALRGLFAAGAGPLGLGRDDLGPVQRALPHLRLDDGPGPGGSVTVNLLPLLTNGAINPAKAASMPTVGWIIIAVAALRALAVLFAPEQGRRSPTRS
jgi:hypothetical protein